MSAHVQACQTYLAMTRVTTRVRGFPTFGFTTTETLQTPALSPTKRLATVRQTLRDEGATLTTTLAPAMFFNFAEETRAEKVRVEPIERDLALSML